METITYSKICLEDLDIGSGTRQVRLADGGLYELHQVSISSLLIPVSIRFTPTAGQSVVLWPSILSGMRVAGVTSSIIISLGTTQGLSSFSLGDAYVIDRWGTQSSLTSGNETGQANFSNDTWNVYSADTSVRMSAGGGLFDGTGLIELTLWYFMLTHQGNVYPPASLASSGTSSSYYAADFTNQTTLTIPYSTHGIATGDIFVQVFDNSSPRALIEPSSVTIDQVTFQVVITFTFTQSGRVIFLKVG